MRPTLDESVHREDLLHFLQRLSRLASLKSCPHIEPAYEYVGGLKWSLSSNDKKQEKTFPAGDQFAPELIHFSGCVRNGKRPEPDDNERLADVRIVEAIYQSASSGRAVPIDPIKPQKRVRSSQAIKRRPVRKPTLVKVQAPHSG